MRGLVIAASILLTPLAAQAADGENVQLAKRVMAITGATDDARASVPPLAETIANGFSSGAGDASVLVNQRALGRAVHTAVHVYTPQFVNAGVQAYAKVYTTAELRQVLAYYHKRESRRGKPPQPLLDKATALAEQRTANIAPLRAKLNQDLFKVYCSRTACNDTVHKIIVTYGHD